MINTEIDILTQSVADLPLEWGKERDNLMLR